MKVKFKKNLGSRDAKSLEVEDFKKCTEGAVVDVPEDAAQTLIGRGWASPVEEDKPLRAVPQETVKAKPEETAKAVTETPKAKK